MPLSERDLEAAGFDVFDPDDVPQVGPDDADQDSGYFTIQTPEDVPKERTPKETRWGEGLGQLALRDAARNDPGAYPETVSRNDGGAIGRIVEDFRTEVRSEPEDDDEPES